MEAGTELHAVASHAVDLPAKTFQVRDGRLHVLAVPPPDVRLAGRLPSKVCELVSLGVQLLRLLMQRRAARSLPAVRTLRSELGLRGAHLRFGLDAQTALLQYVGPQSSYGRLVECQTIGQAGSIAALPLQAAFQRRQLCLGACERLLQQAPLCVPSRTFRGVLRFALMGIAQTIGAVVPSEQLLLQTLPLRPDLLQLDAGDIRSAPICAALRSKTCPRHIGFSRIGSQRLALTLELRQLPALP